MFAVPTQNFMNAIRSYFKDEQAIDQEVSKIVAVVLVIVVLMAIGWFAWNMIGGRADIASNQIKDSTNPGSGNEFSGNPFGN